MTNLRIRSGLRLAAGSELADKALTFVISDSSLNSYGYRVLTAGIDSTDFKKNPIMLWSHLRPDDWNPTDDVFVIGKWENLRVEGDLLLADAVFDQEDEFAKKIESKVRQGMLSACSIGFREIETSEDPIHLLPGQRRPTVTRCKLLECSIVDLPSNPNAVRRLQDSTDKEEQELDKILPKYLKKINPDNGMSKLFYSKLGLSETATELDVITKVTELQNEISALRAEKEAAKKEAQNIKVKTLIDKAIADKKLTESDRSTYTQLAEGNFEATEKALRGMKGFSTIKSEIKETGEKFTHLGDAETYAKHYADGTVYDFSQNEVFEAAQKAYQNLSHKERQALLAKYKK